MEPKEKNNINDTIEWLIKSFPENHYASEEEISFLKRYDKCDDFILSNKLIEDLWSWFRGDRYKYNFDIYNRGASPVSLLHTNSGAGKLLESAPKNTIINAYNLDYICKRITEFVCQERKEKGMFYSFERDISQYFAVCNTNSSRKYNIVITQPDEDSSFYKSIDNEQEVGELSPLEYYTKRASHFVNQNGYLVVICPQNYEIALSRLQELAGMKIVKQLKDKDLEYLSYEVIVFKK